MAERIARLEEWTEGHEGRCEERLSRIDGKFDTLTRGQAQIIRGAWAVVLAICGFLLAQAYTHAIERPPGAAADAAVVARALPR